MKSFCENAKNGGVRIRGGSGWGVWVDVKEEVKLIYGGHGLVRGRVCVNNNEELTSFCKKKIWGGGVSGWMGSGWM